MAHAAVRALHLSCSRAMMCSVGHQLCTSGPGGWAAPEDLSWRPLAKTLPQPSGSSQAENKRKSVASFGTFEFSKTSPAFSKERILKRALVLTLEIHYEGKVVYSGL